MTVPVIVVRIIHDQRAIKPRWMPAATRRGFLASPECSDADFNPISFQVAGGAVDQTFFKSWLMSWIEVEFLESLVYRVRACRVHFLLGLSSAAR